MGALIGACAGDNLLRGTEMPANHSSLQPVVLPEIPSEIRSECDKLASRLLKMSKQSFAIKEYPTRCLYSYHPSQVVPCDSVSVAFKLPAVNNAIRPRGDTREKEEKKEDVASPTSDEEDEVPGARKHSEMPPFLHPTSDSDASSRSGNSPTSRGDGRRSAHPKNSMVSLLQEVVKNGYANDLLYPRIHPPDDGWANRLTLALGKCRDFLSPREESELSKELPILGEVNELMKHPRHKKMDYPLRKGQILALILFFRGKCTQSLRSSLRKPKVEPWKQFDRSLRKAIKALSLFESFDFRMFFSPICFFIPFHRFARLYSHFRDASQVCPDAICSPTRNGNTRFFDGNSQQRSGFEKRRARWHGFGISR